jgi:hypothetical protein
VSRGNASRCSYARPGNEPAGARLPPIPPARSRIRRRDQVRALLSASPACHPCGRPPTTGWTASRVSLRRDPTGRERRHPVAPRHRLEPEAEGGDSSLGAIALDQAQARTLTVLLLDECECARRPDRVLRDSSLSSGAQASRPLGETLESRERSSAPQSPQLELSPLTCMDAQLVAARIATRVRVAACRRSTRSARTSPTRFCAS